MHMHDIERGVLYTKKYMKAKKLTVKELFEEKFLYNDNVLATASKFLLASLAAGPLLLVGAVLPGLLQATKSFDNNPKRYSKKQVQNACKNLQYRKFIKILKVGDDTVKVQLTNKGKKRLMEFSVKFLEIKKPIKWDGKWRVLIFDIPTKPNNYNQARNALRNKIKKLNFFQIQKSVWVYPYECEDEILFVAELFNVQQYIEIITAEKILHEDKIRKNFKL